MKSLGAISIVFILNMYCLGQEGNPIKTNERKFPVRIVLLDGQLIKGSLISLGDSTLEISEKRSQTIRTFHVRDINKILIRKKMNVWLGTLAGLSVGIAVDILLADSGYGADEEIPVGPTLVYVFTPITAAFIGSRVGKSISTTKINAQQQSFEAFKVKMRKKGFRSGSIQD